MHKGVGRSPGGRGLLVISLALLQAGIILLIECLFLRLLLYLLCLHLEIVSFWNTAPSRSTYLPITLEEVLWC